MRSSALNLENDAAFGVARSFSGRKWILQRADEDAVRELALASGISTTLARLLTGRGFKADDVFDVLNPTLKRLMPDPLTLLNMDRAVARGASTRADRSGLGF